MIAVALVAVVKLAATPAAAEASVVTATVGPQRRHHQGEAVAEVLVGAVAAAAEALTAAQAEAAATAAGARALVATAPVARAAVAVSVAAMERAAAPLIPLCPPPPVLQRPHHEQYP